MRVKNWEKFQHFKDRTPPWIKLHKTILDQRDINMISDGAFRVLIGLWLLASEDSGMRGELPEIDDISFRLRIEKPKLIKALGELGAFLIKDDDKEISEGYQDDDPEEETEEETEEEDNNSESKNRFAEFWDAFADKRGKQGAERVWKRKKLDNKADAVIAGAAAYAKARGLDKQYWKQAQGWLNDGRWEDDHVQVQVQVKPEWASLPRSDDDLWGWATKNGFRAPGRSETYIQYRKALEIEIEKRMANEEG